MGPPPSASPRPQRGCSADRQTGPVDGEVQAAVAARVPGAATLGLVLPPGVDVVPATALTDPVWTAEVLAERARWQGTSDLRVLATVWWYSASTVLLTPALAGLATGRPLSARPADTVVALLPGRPADRGGVDGAGDRSGRGAPGRHWRG